MVRIGKVNPFVRHGCTQFDCTPRMFPVPTCGPRSRLDDSFDIGANVGEYSEIFASLGMHVVAVEPFPEHVAILERLESKKLHHKS